MIFINSLLNFLQHIENITLNISMDTFVMETTIIYFMYQFIFWGHFTLHFNLNFLVYLKVDFIISHPRLPFPLLLYIATLTVVHLTYTEEGILLLPMPFWVWGTDSEKHPLLHLLTKPSECHQPQDHEGHQQISANPYPPNPSLKSTCKIQLDFSVKSARFQCEICQISVSNRVTMYTSYHDHIILTSVYIDSSVCPQNNCIYLMSFRILDVFQWEIKVYIIQNNPPNTYQICNVCLHWILGKSTKSMI